MELQGTYTALATPFTDDTESIDYASLDNLLEYQISSKIQGIVACGSTAEAASLSDQEYLDLLGYLALKCKGKLPCIGGIITNNTKRACALGAHMSSQKLDAILLVTPPYIKPTQEGIIEHFKAVKAASRLPIIAYNIPGRSATAILPETLAKMTQENLICGVKDSTGSIENVQQVISLAGKNLSVLSGEDALVYPVIACGGRGVISASANLIPEAFVKITSAALSGDFQKASAEQMRILEVIKTLFMETNPIVLKSALFMKGIIKSDAVRIPLTRARPETRAKLKTFIS